MAAAAAAAPTAWLAEHAQWASLPTAVAAVLAAVAGGWLGRLLAGRAAGHHIAWDGASWSVDAQPGALEVVLDLGRGLLLLRLRSRPGAVDQGRRSHPVRWFAVEAPAAAAASAAGGSAGWRALRTALYSSPPAATLAEPSVRAPDRAAD